MPQNLPFDSTVSVPQLDILEPRLFLTAAPALPAGALSAHREPLAAPALPAAVAGAETPPPAAGTLASVRPTPAAAPLVGQPAGPHFMLGTVHVTLVLMESNGSVDANTENWNSTLISQVKSGVQQGLSWWEQALAKAYPNSPQTLSFSLDTTYADAPVATGYEPIARASADEGLWINDFLDAVGYNTPADPYSDLARWNNDQRIAHNTDWAYTIFVANSAADRDGKFTDGLFAYAYRNGPFLVLTSDNANWGVARIGQVAAHETGHIFGALDEYPRSAGYNTTSGVYQTQNLNAFDYNPNPAARVASIMAEARLQNLAWANFTSSPSSLQMIGWRDTNGNNVMDVVEGITAPASPPAPAVPLV